MSRDAASAPRTGPAGWVSLGWRVVAGRPRLLGAIAFGIAVAHWAPSHWVSHAGSRALIGWNATALLYLALAAWLMRRADVEAIRRRAADEDAGSVLVLLLSMAAAVAVLVAVGSQLGAAKGLGGVRRDLHVALAALTVVTAWLFTQTLFALHYAHEFYGARIGGEPDPLAFPGTDEPEYPDFFYFAAIIGTSGQTADVSFQGRALRPIGTLHCLLAFAFNTSVLALAINIGASLI